MNQKISVLIVEDHPLTSFAYKSAFEIVGKTDNEFVFKIDIVNDCDSADQKIMEGVKENGIDIVFLDISLPPSKNGEILSGEDLGLKIRRVLPKAKIAISTTFYDNYRIQSIIKSVNPEGFLIKSDFNSKELIYAIQKIILTPPYYSTTVLKSLRKQLSSNYTLDEIDRKLLYELSIGTKMKELPKVIALSMAGIEKRKRQLKEIFDIKKKDDRELILKAKEKGFI